MSGSVLEPSARDALRRLSYLDGDRVSVIRHLSEARDHAVHDTVFEQMDAAARAAAAALAEIRSRRKSLEEHLQDLQARLVRSSQRLNSGQLSTQREVSAVEAEIAQTGSAIADAEEQLLEAMVAEEQRAEAARTAQEVLAGEQPRAERRRRASAAKAAELEARVKQIDLDRRDAAQRLPHEVVERYRLLFPKTGGRPFSQAAAGECGNCHHMLPASAVQLLRTHTGVPVCPSCGRLLIEAS